MIRIDAELLVQLGYRSLTKTQANELSKALYDTLERIVGIRLAGSMSEDQLDAFNGFFEAKDDAGAFAWIQRNFPGYRDMVQNEFEELKAVLAVGSERTRAVEPRNA